MTASAGPSQTAAADPLDRYCHVGGVRLRYRDEGTGPCVLLVHGWTLDLEMWEPQVAALRRDFRLVRLDRRGHGLSAGLPDTAGDAADLAALCRHLGIARCGLIGMSQGARGVLGFASTAPEQVTAMILDGPRYLMPARAMTCPSMSSRRSRSKQAWPHSVASGAACRSCSCAPAMHARTRCWRP